MNNDSFAELLENPEQRTYKYFDGQTWKLSSSGKTIPVISPHDQTNVGNVQAVTREEVDSVIEHAKKAQIGWEQTPLSVRIEKVKKAATFLREHENYFTDILTGEIGKTKQESQSEVLRTADIIDFCTTEVLTLNNYSLLSDPFPGYKKGIVANVERVAHGVILAIGPFNYPLNLVASKIAPGLLMGNSIVVKPPMQGSISGLLLTQAFITAGVPEGVLSCITGEGREIGDYLASHPGISMIAFTGSSGVGEAIAKKAGMKPLLFECGGNNGVIVHEDADLQKATKEIVKGGFSYAGQRCTGIKYILTTKKIQDELLPMILEEMKSIVHMGDPRNDTTKLVGPVISVKAAEEIEQIINDAVSHGAEIVTGGKRNGSYIEPTILKNVTMDTTVVKEETFGPVISFIEIDTMEQAISLMNNSAYGLQASIFTTNEDLGKEIAKKLQVGTVQINGSPQRGPDNFPFTGIKASGLGVQGIRYSLEAMSRVKSIVLNPS